MLELVTPLRERVTVKAPQQMSGPNVYRLSRQVQDAFAADQEGVVIDFDGVDYIDLHGLVLLKDLCDLVEVCGGRTWAAHVAPDMLDILEEAELLGRTPHARQDGEYELRSA